MKHKIIVFKAFLLSFLSACTFSNNDGSVLAQMTFNNVKAFPVYVASYEPVNINKGKTHLLPEGLVTDPAPLIYDYLNNRFKASGNQGKLRIEIRDVIIRHEILKSDKSLQAVIGFGKKDHYNIKAYIDITVFGSGDTDNFSQSMIVSRNIYVSEYLSLVDREKLQMQAIDNMIDDLDIALRKILKDKFKIL